MRKRTMVEGTTRTNDAVFYQYSQNPILRYAARVSGKVRKSIVAKFIAASGIHPDSRVLDVGVTSDQSNTESNIFEQFYPYKDRIIAVGVANASHLRKTYPGLQAVVSDGKHLAFRDASVDHVFCNAVIEHVGNRKEQSMFIGELVRVARNSVAIATPNRWFPLELHVFLPFLHYLPPAWFRAILKRFRREPYDSEDHLNLLSKKDLIELCEKRGISNFHVVKQRLFGFTSNLILFITK